MIPDEARQQLAPLMPEAPWELMELTIGKVPSAAIGPHALAPRNILAVSAKGIARALKTVGMTVGRHIFIDVSHAAFKTAAGLALLGHEIVHVEQGERDPDFERKYDRAARATPPDRPWENPYEQEAYVREVQLYRMLIGRGLPPGRWEPLGVSLGWG